jgi:hypothetical protein
MKSSADDKYYHLMRQCVCHARIFMEWRLFLLAGAG